MAVFQVLTITFRITHYFQLNSLPALQKNSSFTPSIIENCPTEIVAQPRTHLFNSLHNPPTPLLASEWDYGASSPPWMCAEVKCLISGL